MATLIESAIVYHNSADYELAVNCFQMAKEAWLKALKEDNKPPKNLQKECELFFALSIASV